jgi:hypothetical protein
MPSVETDASSPARTGFAALAVACAAAGLAGLLWWRFGDRVYTVSLMEAFLACF